MKSLEMSFEVGGFTSKESMYVVEENEINIHLCSDEDSEDTVWIFEKSTGICINDNTFLGARRYIETIK